VFSKPSSSSGTGTFAISVILGDIAQMIRVPDRIDRRFHSPTAHASQTRSYCSEVGDLHRRRCQLPIDSGDIRSHCETGPNSSASQQTHREMADRINPRFVPEQSPQGNRHSTSVFESNAQIENGSKSFAVPDHKSNQKRIFIPSIQL
jgi:hypothetical protein